MKRTLFCFFSILLVHAVTAQTEEPQTSNSPGQVETTSPDGLSITMDDYRAIAKKVENRAKKVEEKYFVQKQIINEYSGATTFQRTAVKPRIYKAGQVLIKESQSKIESYPENDFKSRYVILKQIDRVYDRLTYYSRESNTRAIEKQLKKLKTADAIAPVFFGE